MHMQKWQAELTSTQAWPGISKQQPNTNLCNLYTWCTGVAGMTATADVDAHEAQQLLQDQITSHDDPSTAY
jgi:hypothetical protein